MLEELEVDHGPFLHQFDDHEGNEKDDGEAEAKQDAERGPARIVPVNEPPDEQRERGTEGHDAADVETPGVSVVRFADEGEGAKDQRRAGRDVYQEHPPPPEELGDE